MRSQIPLLDLKKQLAPIRAEINDAVSKVIDTGKFLFGPQVTELETAVQAYTGSSHAVAVSNGTDAIRLALVACGVGPGDAVICPTYTYYATAGAVASIGAIPVFAEMDPRTYTLDAAGTKKALAAGRNRGLSVKAVIPVHLYGQCADMDPLMEFCRAEKLKVIEDTAQAFGATYKGKKAGTFGDCGTVSFFPGKNLGAFGDAGMVLTSDHDLHKELLLLRNQGNKEKYFHEVVGFNHRMDTLQAAVLLVKLNHLDSWNGQRAANAEYYRQALKDTGLSIPFVPRHNTHIYHQYVLRCGKGSAGIIKSLRDKQIDTRVYYPVPLHLQPCFKYLGYSKGEFPESESASTQTFAIPVHPDLTQEEKEYIVSSIKESLHE